MNDSLPAGITYDPAIELTKTPRELCALIAHNMSLASNSIEFKVDSIYTINVDGMDFEVGPFIKQAIKYSEFSYEEIFVARFGNSEYGIGLYAENWDSWGVQYGNDGVNFEVIKFKNPKMIFDIEIDYEATRDSGLNFPHRMSW